MNNYSKDDTAYLLVTTIIRCLYCDEETSINSRAETECKEKAKSLVWEDESFIVTYELFKKKHSKHYYKSVELIMPCGGDLE